MHHIRTRFEYEMTKYESGAPFGITPCHLDITLEYSIISNASSCLALLSTFCSYVLNPCRQEDNITYILRGRFLVF